MFCRNANIRQQFTARRLLVVIFFITLPIVVIEAIGLALFRPELTLDMNADESIGRFECGAHNEQIFFLSNAAVLLFTIFLCLFEAQRSRRLPGLFNEAESVCFALLSSLLLGGLGYAVILVSSDSTAHPNAPYIMEVILVCYIATILVIRLTVPKLKLIFKGEKVAIANILSEHRKSRRRKSDSSVPTSTGGISVLSESFRQLNQVESETHKDSMALETMVAPAIPSISETEKSVTFDKIASKLIAEPSQKIASNVAMPRANQIVLVQGQEPPDRLMFRVVEHTNIMSRVNERLLSGLLVDRDDWEKLKSSLDELHGLLEYVEYT
jgi:hypothetical protein